MFERFTDRARRVIVLAQEEARTLQHNYIGTEHLLLGLIREGEGVAAKALASKGVTLDDTRKQVEEMIGKGNASPNGHIPFTPHARQVLELSLREALQLGHSYIGTEHILLGLIHEGEGVGTQVLIKMDVNLGELRSATIDLIRGNSSDGKNDGKGELANAGGVQDRRNQTGSAILDQFGRNLTAEAAAGKLDPVIGRSNEIERVMVVLSRRTKNNPVLIGEPGVGKTAIAEGLAERIASGDVPEELLDKKLLSLDLSGMVAGTKYRGEFEERIKNNTLTEVLNAVPVHKGDCFFIPAGTLHAICKGIVIAEVQQNSNVTYRVYDYGRVGADGKPRALHVEKALDVTLRTPPVKHDFGNHLAQGEYFTVDAKNGAFEDTADEKSFVSLLVTDGEGELTCGGETVVVKKGDSFFLPAGSGSYAVRGTCQTLVTRV